MTNDPYAVETPENWDAACYGYSEKIAPQLMRPFAEELVNRLNVTTESNVLEVAAGSGALTECLFPQVRSILATDFSPRMIEVLRARLSDLEADNVTYEVMNGQDLAVNDDSFDAAACMFALMLFPDRQRGFSELYRVVRPGGRVAVSGWSGPDQFEVFGVFLAALKTAFPQMPEPSSPPPVFSLADPVAFKSQMESAGFREVRVDQVARPLEIPDFDTMWSMLTVGAPPVRLLFDRIGETGKTHLRQTLSDSIRERFGDAPMRFANVATVGSGVVA